ncbi:MAG: exodeoxyribonuclease VII large subunit [Alcanivorax sp.]
MSKQAELLSNVPEFSVSELAFSVKKSIEDNFGRVRVRGELSRISIPKSGHIYTTLKDDKAVIDAICWRGVVSKLSVRPEEGLEVICTGKMTTYPGNSKYQLVIESMELAGEGALLKMLEERKKKLAAEGLFAPERKKARPFLPTRIGVVTSPTGAVIRDILHRLQDRFPRHVLVWPVKVQGDGAAEEITQAIDGFNALDETLRPDLIIVARGGGSLEDLMPFNEENVVRATARSVIPIISAVGHETDTTLIDYASDLRAPTPTGAAEVAVPVRLDLLAQVTDNEKRLINGITRTLAERKHRTEALAAKLGDPKRLLELKTQHLDRAGDRIDHALSTYISRKRDIFMRRAMRLTHPKQMIQNRSIHLSGLSERLVNTGKRTLQDKDKLLKRSTEKLEILSFENVLNRGYVVVRDENGTPVTSADTLKNDQNISLQFKGKKHIDARITKGEPKSPPKKSNNNKKPEPPKDQGSLF